jgi:hypothetical protein
MFDDPASLRAAARQYRRSASQTSDHDVIYVFNAVADQYALKAAALEIERQNGTILRAWDSLRSTPLMTMPPEQPSLDMMRDRFRALGDQAALAGSSNR